MADDKGIHLSVQGDTEVRIEQGENDVNQRDPNNLNEHLKVQFEEVFGEPNPGVFSFDKIWLLSSTVFATTKLWTYRIISLILALPLMVLWGIYFALISFITIWCCVPCLRAYEMKMNCMKKIYTTIIDTFYVPLCEATGLIFSKIRIQKV